MVAKNTGGAGNGVDGAGDDVRGGGNDDCDIQPVVAVGRLIKPVQVVLTDAAVVACPITKEAMFKTDVSLSLLCGAPLLVDTKQGDEQAIHCTTIPYMSICTGFYVPRDRVMVHDHITFNPVEGLFEVWDETQGNVVGGRASLRGAEEVLEQYVRHLNKEHGDAGTEDN